MRGLLFGRFRRVSVYFLMSRVEKGPDPEKSYFSNKPQWVQREAEDNEA